MQLQNPAAFKPPLMAQRIDKLKRNANLAFSNNPIASGPMSSPPTITHSNVGTSGNSRFYDVFSSGSTFRTNWEFDVSGGEPYSGGNGMLKAYSTNNATGSVGNLDGSTKMAHVYRIAMMTDAATLDLRVLGSSTPYRVLIDNLDGKGSLYTSFSTLTSYSGGGYVYMRIPFGARQPKGRIITLECYASGGFLGAYVGPTESVWKPPQGDRVKMGLIGDSVAASTGVAWNGDGFAQVMGHYMGVKDMRQIAIGGTGYIIPTSITGQQWPYASHSTDWTGITDWDGLVFTGGNNDNGQTATAIQAAVTSIINTTRAALPQTPLWFFGPDSFVTPSTNVLAVETGISNAVASFGDSTIQFVPLCVLADGGGSELFGTGNVTATTGDGNADFYTGNTASADPVHPNIDGHAYRGMFRANLWRKHLFLM